MDAPRLHPNALVRDLSPRAVEGVLALLDLHPWVGSPSAQVELDRALGALVGATLGPPDDSGPEPPAWMAGSHGRADLASVRATTARLRRLSHELETERPAAASACRQLGGALALFAEELREVSLLQRSVSPQGNGPGPQPIGALRASKRLAASCRQVAASLGQELPG